MENSNQTKPKSENPFINLTFNILIPAILLTKGNKWFGWSPSMALCIALFFPLAYGLIDFLREKRINPLSILGLASIFLTGVVGLLQLPKEWIAVKEAAIPLIIGLVIYISMKTKYPLIRGLIYNDKILNIKKIDRILEEKALQPAADSLLTKCSYLVVGSFVLSSILNFTLAKIIIQSDTGTQAFTEELGKMTVWSYPVIALPCTLVLFVALWILLSGLKKLTGLSFEEVLHQPIPDSSPEESK